MEEVGAEGWVVVVIVAVIVVVIVIRGSIQGESTTEAKVVMGPSPTTVFQCKTTGNNDHVLVAKFGYCIIIPSRGYLIF